MSVDEILGILLRWAHIASAIALIGGVLYARCVARGMSDEAAARFRSLALWTVAAILASGIYNVLQKTGVRSPYHAVFGIKVLLALHVFAVAIVLGKPGMGEAKRMRLMTGVAISGLTIAALSAYLRWVST